MIAAKDGVLVIVGRRFSCESNQFCFSNRVLDVFHLIPLSRAKKGTKRMEIYLFELQGEVFVVLSSYTLDKPEFQEIVLGNHISGISVVPYKTWNDALTAIPYLT